MLHALAGLLAAAGRDEELAAIESELAEFPDVAWGQPDPKSAARIA